MLQLGTIAAAVASADSLAEHLRGVYAAYRPDEAGQAAPLVPRTW
ncbi:hypothetical protein ACWEKJ_05145 [Amycolatopsis thermoflava]